MKNMKKCLLLLPLLLMLTGCSNEEILKEPPRSTVICGDQQIPAHSGNYSWDYKNADGSTSSVIADAIHPLDSQVEAVVTDQATATLRFGEQPQRISVSCWSEDQRGNIQAAASYPLLNGNELSLRSGSYIYAISASWEAKRYSGSCTYVVCINSTFEEPTLTKPPVLTVTCGDKTATAKLGTYTWSHSTGGGLMTTTNADSSHPLQILSAEDRVEFDKGYVYLNFEVPPDRMESFCWYDTDLGKSVGGNPINDYWAGYRLDPAYGGLIIEVHAYWDDRNGYEGDASYCFYIDKQPDT